MSEEFAEYLKKSAAGMLACCKANHDIVEGPQDPDAGNIFLFWCRPCDKDYLQLAVAFDLTPPDWSHYNDGS